MPAESVPLLELHNVRKRYDDEAGKLVALKGIDLSIARGEFVALMGPSGSGKSTLMHILGLLDTPSSGQYLLNGRDVSHASEHELALLRRQTIGFVFQAFNLLPRFNVLENVQLPLLYQGVSGRKRRQAAKKVLAQVDLAGKLSNKPSQLSGGQVQRAAIARALINQPELILADEPTGNLDSHTGADIMRLLTQLNHSGVTIVVVTHDPEVAVYAQKIYYVRDGELTQRRKTTLERQL